MFRPHSPYGKVHVLGELGQLHQQSVVNPDHDHHRPNAKYRLLGKTGQFGLHPLFCWGNHQLYLLLADPD